MFASVPILDQLPSVYDVRCTMYGAMHVGEEGV